MGLSAVVAGAARDPWTQDPASAPMLLAQERPSWQKSRVPVDRAQFERLVEAARTPRVLAPEPKSVAVADAGSPLARVPTVDADLDGIGRNLLDPADAALAVGPNDLMTAVNAKFAVAPKDGSAPFAPVSFSAMFGPVLPPDATFMVDPKLAFDHFAQRWIFIVIAKRDDPPGSWILLAASQTEDPHGSYYTWALDASLDGTTATDNWADYPTLGFDEQAIYVAANMIRFNGVFEYAKLRILNKREAYAAPGLTAPALRWYDISVILDPNRHPVFALYPATHHRDAPGPAYFANAAWPRGKALTVWTLTNPLAGWQTPPAAPRFTGASIACQSYDVPPAAKQPGTPKTISTDDAKLLNAVYHGDGPSKGLWTTQSSKYTWPGDSEARSVAQWYQIDVTASRLVQQGRHGAPGVYHFFPAILPIANGDTFMVFARSSSADFPQLRAAGRHAADPPGTLSDSVVLQPGAGAFLDSRWGDYFSVARDPNDDGTAWLCGQYAGSAGTWGTKICSVFF